MKVEELDKKVMMLYNGGINLKDVITSSNTVY